MDWYMFTPEELEYLHFLASGDIPQRYVPEDEPAPKRRRTTRAEEVRPPKLSWRVFGDKTNQKTGVNRRYYLCMCCKKARRVVVSRKGYLVENKTYITHEPNCLLEKKTTS